VEPSGGPLARSDAAWVAALLAVWAGSRLGYSWLFGVRFDASTLDWYLQFIDPELLRTRLLESAFAMRDQPPAFNLLLGAVLKVAGAGAPAAFRALYGLAGVVLVVALWSLMRRMGVLAPVAFVVVALFAASPVTVLYESWLFYTYPIMVLLCVAALALHRFVESAKARDAAVLYALLAVVVLTRGTFHLAWFVAVVAGTALAVRGTGARRLAAAAAIPCALVLGLYLKNFLTFGDWFAGRIYRDMNYAQMVLQNVPRATLDRLVREGRLSPIVYLSIYRRDLEAFRPFLGEVERTGIPVLDRERKSTGHPSWQSLTMQRVGRRMAEAADVAARHVPDAWRRSVVANARLYFRPADQAYPFVYGDQAIDYGDPNAIALASLLELRRALVGQAAIGKPAWLYVVGLPALLLYGAAYLSIRAGRRELLRPDAVTAAFLVFNILYLAAVTVLFSHGDHARYRLEVAPFYAVLCAMALSAAARWTARRRGSGAATP
jgi:hypothetical protein